jgi:hypothetical protein
VEAYLATIKEFTDFSPPDPAHIRISGIIPVKVIPDDEAIWLQDA